MDEKKTNCLYRVIRRLVRLFSPRFRVAGTENLPEEPCVIVGNHSQMYGPIAGELYTPGKHYIWCAGEMMHRKEVAAYAFQDFWSNKPKATRWFFRLLSHLIAPLSEPMSTPISRVGVAEMRFGSHFFDPLDLNRFSSSSRSSRLSNPVCSAGLIL